MTRIVAGTARGRRLVVPAGDATRPTSSRTREALFSSLESQIAGWAQTSVLDLYAGSGALGLEAASRGARDVVLVESNRQAWHACRENIAVLGFAMVRLHRSDAAEFLRGQPPQRFEVVLADPPYALPNADVTDVLTDLATGAWLAPGARVVVERPARESGFTWPAQIEHERSKRYGDALLWYGRAWSASA